MTDMSSAFIVAVSAGALRCGTPILLAALGEVISERAGIINLGLEGIMLMGAVVGVGATLASGSPTIGMLAAVVVGSALGLVHAVACIRFGANQIASGIALMILGSGLSAFLGIELGGQKIPAILPISIPVLSSIPYLGPVLFEQDVLIYVTYVLIPAVAILLYRTRLGVAIRAAGDEPEAAASAGIQVERVRYGCVAAGGAMAGLGGAYLSLVYAQSWVENITYGRGLIAVGLVIFAAWNPWKAALGAILFGGATSLQLRLQATGADVSQYLLGLVPYVSVIVVLVVVASRTGKTQSAMPAALGKPYVKQP